MVDRYRKINRTEAQTMLLKHLGALVDYWHDQDMSKREAMEGLVFSILVTIDGESAALPKFLLVPDPHPDDRDYHRKMRTPYFPDAPRNIPMNLSGDLHEHWAQGKV